ncbi:AraC-type DNA-binding protein [Tenacibaculum sp. MAR_2009_124]|uniref:AraC family transcriptional regulator n=1 Tax=Tenacibaculum sp. MAR_2009_124 TaxID=1250059 RepID=UPI00089BB7E8|nr:helix-turn-helix transcriptional regulator [Tenacibaculum sp. MAR_2009_124]SEB42110.1 AraC-type DNA-binding protein [Tenacibaculum sp. MAR_2009_124]
MKKDIPKINFQPAAKENFNFEIVPINKIANKQIKEHNSELPHQLKFYNIIFFIQGRGRHYIDFKWYPIKEKSLVFLAKDQVHAFDFSSNLEGYCMVFTENFFLNCFSEFPNNYLLHLFNSQFSRSVVEVPEDSDVINYFNLLLKEFQTKNTFNNINVTKSLLTVLLSKAEGINEGQNKNAIDSLKVTLFKQFNLLLDINYKESRNANFYADKLAITYKHLNEVCKEVSNKTAKNVIDDFLILIAKRKLINTSIKSTKLAYELGFEDSTNFTKYFKKNTGFTPKEFLLSIKRI